MQYLTKKWRIFPFCNAGELDCDYYLHNHFWDDKACQNFEMNRVLNRFSVFNQHTLINPRNNRNILRFAEFRDMRATCPYIY